MSFIIITLKARGRKLAKYYEIFLLEKNKVSQHNFPST